MPFLRLNRISLFIVNFILGGIVYSLFPFGLLALFILGMQDSAASTDDIFRLKIFGSIIFAIGGSIGILVTFLQRDGKTSAFWGCLIPSFIFLGFFLFDLFEGKGFSLGMIIGYLFYVMPGFAVGLACGSFAEKAASHTSNSHDS
jgi:hypothetical protein